MISSIVESYGILFNDSLVEPLVGGLINTTWKITFGDQQYILQRINDSVFKKPYELAANIEMLDQYLATHAPGYLFVSPIKNIHNKSIVQDHQQGYFRLFHFVKGSHTINVVTAADQAFEASRQFGKFTRLLSGFDTTQLNLTIPDFHNLALRYSQFEDAIRNGNSDRIKQSESLIGDIRSHQYILDSFEKIKKIASVPTRVTHNDTKISNVLFDDHGKGICIIDLDTVMPGYFISDVGDMMRTYLSPATEEEKNFNLIEVRDDFFRAIVQGYLCSMGDELNPDEKELIFYSGLFLIYMQAIRFLADYCNNDSYYGAKYEDHNFVRAGNQLQLLKKLEEKRSVFQNLISNELNRKSYLFNS
jgi:Ser/Thr protein kinase RdoA (MazF antagonist)